VKKVRLCDDNSVEKLKKQPNFYAKEAQIISVFFTNKSMILHLYKEAYFNTNDLNPTIPSVAIVVFTSTYETRIVSIVFISCSIFTTYLTYWVLFHHIAYCVPVFIRVFSFVHILG
jgi:hypothetical protein